MTPTIIRAANRGPRFQTPVVGQRVQAPMWALVLPSFCTSQRERSNAPRPTQRSRVGHK